MESLQKLYIHELKDLYSAEGQLIEALPKLAAACQDDELKGALKHHLDETREHQKRLEGLFKGYDFAPGGHKCKGMEGLLKEAAGLLSADISPDVLDAALIGACQRCEHYEIAGYGTARAYAMKLGDQKAADVLAKTLDEEGAADTALTRLAEKSINFEAMKS